MQVGSDKPTAVGYTLAILKGPGDEPGIRAVTLVFNVDDAIGRLLSTSELVMMVPRWTMPQLRILCARRW